MIAHDVLSYVCADSLGFGRESIEINCNSYDTDLYNAQYSMQMREGKSPAVSSPDPALDESEYYSDFVRYHEPVDGKVPIIEVLAIYSAEPDWGMDSGLRLSPFQFLTGGSQGYRHLRYALFCFRVGIAHKRALYYSELARQAFHKGDTYWGIRFSARALHFIQDLSTPFHTKPFPEYYLFEKLFHLRELYFTTYNLHLNYERLIAYRLWKGEEWLIKPIRDAFPAKISDKISDLEHDLLRASARARSLLNTLFDECRLLWGEGMREGFVALSRKDIEGLLLTERLRTTTCRWLSSAASLVKGYIQTHVLPYLKDRNG